MSAFRNALTGALERIEELDAAEVASLVAAPARSADAAAGRRALALSGHGVTFGAVDKALRDARPDLSPQVRVALRWAVLAEAFRDSLTREQYDALAGTFATMNV